MNATDFLQKRSKINDGRVVILPLITVWLQVRVLPGPPAKSGVAGASSLPRGKNARMQACIPHESRLTIFP
jgi:hypothetical protein